MYLIEITNDLYDIAARLSSINDGYRVYYNARLRRYEVHDKHQYGDALAFVVPYAELDARTVDYALYTRRENADKVLADVEDGNARAQAANAYNVVNRIAAQLY